MRVIAGSARSLRLKTIEGLDTRPTTDRIKETLFNILQYDLADCRFLDLFSGSGAIGIEALSRGAREAVFVEQQKTAADCIRENLSFTKLEDRAIVMQCGVQEAICRLEHQGQAFDIIFMDPPYHQEHEKRALSSLAESPLLHPDTLLIVETDLETDVSYAKELGYEITRTKIYKTNQHVFLTRSQARAAMNSSGTNEKRKD